MKACYKILFNKPLEYEEAFIFRGRDHIEDFCDMIYLLSKDVKKEMTELTECRKELRSLKDRI